MKYQVPNPSRINMADLPKGRYIGQWKPGPLRELHIGEWELMEGESRLSIATATSMHGDATLEFSFLNSSVVVFQEKQL